MIRYVRIDLPRVYVCGLHGDHALADALQAVVGNPLGRFRLYRNGIDSLWRGRTHLASANPVQLPSCFC